MKTLRTLILLLGLVAPLVALAHDAPAPEAKPDAKPEGKVDARPDKEGFTAVQPGEMLGPGETLPASNLVGAAYGFILATLVAWVASVAVRARKVEEELASLRSKIDKQV